MLYSIEEGSAILCGAVHFLPEGYELPRRYFEKALASEVCYFESDLDAPANLSGSMYPPGDFLGRRVPRDTMGKLSGLASTLGIENFTRCRPWRAEQLIVVNLITKAKNSVGVDRQIWDEVKSAGKKLIALEQATLEEIFGRVRPKEQLFKLDYLAANPAKPVENYDRILNAWLTNDPDAIRSVMSEESKRFPDTYHRVFSNRDRLWLPKILHAIQGTSPAFVCVGAGHLVGEGGVVDLLAEEGVTASLLS